MLSLDEDAKKSLGWLGLSSAVGSLAYFTLIWFHHGWRLVPLRDYAWPAGALILGAASGIHLRACYRRAPADWSGPKQLALSDLLSGTLGFGGLALLWKTFWPDSLQSGLPVLYDGCMALIVALWCARVQGHRDLAARWLFAVGSLSRIVGRVIVGGLLLSNLFMGLLFGAQRLTYEFTFLLMILDFRAPVFDWSIALFRAGFVCLPLSLVCEGLRKRRIRATDAASSPKPTPEKSREAAP